MKKDQVRIGNLYTAKVSGGIAQVRIEAERWLGDKHAGWKGVNTATGRAVTIKSAQRLRAAVGGEAPAPSSGEVAPSGEAGAEVVAVAGSPRPPKGGATKAAAKAFPKATKPAAAKEAKAPAPKKPPAKSERPKANGPMSGLDAAHKVLVETREPMNCKELVAETFKRKYWRSEGATPEATLSAAIGREIRAKGGDARFKKAGRGLFAAAKS